MSRYDDLFDLIEETNDAVEEILEYARSLEKKLDEAIALLREMKK
jgi:hypothetical protein